MIEVVVASETLVCSKRGSITGEIFLRSAKYEFPDGRWSDFPVVILGWWIDGLNGIVGGSVSSYEGHFMDGPYSFVVELSEGEGATLSWGRRNEQEIVGHVKVNEVLESALAAGRCVLLACRERGWVSKDLDVLQQLVSRAAA